MAEDNTELFSGALLCAAQAGYTEEIIPAATVCKALLNDANLWGHILRFQASPPRFDKPGSRRCWSLRTTLMAACKTGNVDRVAFILRSCLALAAASHTARVAIANWKDAEGKSALHRAIEEGHEGCIRELLVSGLVDLELKDREGKSALYVATFNGHIDIAKLLLAHTPKPDVTTKDHSGHGLLSEDAFYSKVPAERKDEIAILLLQNGIFPPKNFSRRALNEGGPGEAVCLELIERGFITADFIRDDYSLVPGGNPYEHPELPRDEDWPLFCAISNGLSDRVILRLLDCQSVRFGSCVEFGDRALYRSPLHALCERNGSLAVMKRMFERGAASIIDSRMGWGETALHTAAKHCDEEISHFLLAQGADASISDGMFELPFYAAASNGREELALLLLEAAVRSAAQSSTFFITDYLGRERFSSIPLLIAAEQGLGRLVERLLDLGADQTVRHRHTKRTGLSEACRQGHIEIARLLLSHLPAGADFDMNIFEEGAEHCWLRCPLTYACQWPGKPGVEELVKGLLERGAKVSFEPNPFQLGLDGPLHVLLSAKDGTEADKLALLDILLSASGVDVNPIHRHGKSPVYLAATRGYYNIVRRLHEAGADLDQQSNDEWSPLQRAVKRGYIDTVKALVECGADIDYEAEDLVFNSDPDDGGSDDEGDGGNYNTQPHSALSVAVLSSEEAPEEIALYLIEKGASVQPGFPTTEILRMACFEGLDTVVLAALEAAWKQNPTANMELLDLSSEAAFYKREKLALRLLDMKKTSAAGPEEREQQLKNSCFLNACKHGLLELAKAMVTGWKVDVNEKFHTPDTLTTGLHAASAGGHVDVVVFLLDSGADPLARDNEGRTAFFVSVQECRVDVVKLFLDRVKDARVFNQVDSLGKRPLFCACMGNRIDILRLLLADSRVERNIVGPPGDDDADACNPLLIEACSSGFEEEALILLEAGFDPHIRGPRGEQAVHVAARRGLLKVLEKLISLGITPDSRDYRGRSPLFYAASQGRLEAMRFLLAIDKRLADAKTCEEKTILMAAAEAGQTDAILLLIIKYKVPVAAMTLKGETALMLAIQNKHSSAARVLLKNSTSAELDHTTHRLSRMRPLRYAVEYEMWEVALELLERGCSARHEYYSGTLLQLAFKHTPAPIDVDEETGISEIRNLFGKVVTQALLNGADPRTPAKGYFEWQPDATALDVAVEHGSPEEIVQIIERLLREGEAFQIRWTSLFSCVTRYGKPTAWLALRLLEPDVLPQLRTKEGNDFDVNEQDAIGNTFISRATKANLPSVVMRLIALGADPFKTTNERFEFQTGAHCLHEAALLGRAEVIRCILGSPKANSETVNAACSMLRTSTQALSLTIESLQCDAALAILDDGRVDVNAPARDASDQPTSALVLACRKHSNVVVRRLLQKDARDKEAAFQEAVAALNLEAVKLLVAAFPGIGMGDVLLNLLQEDRLRLRGRNIDDRMPMLTLLLSLRASLSPLVISPGSLFVGLFLSLATASQTSYGAALRLLKAGATLDIQMPPLSCTLVMLAAASGRDDLVSLLCEHGADLHTVDSRGLCVLDYSCMGSRVPTYRRAKIARILLAAGALPNVGPGPCTTELHLACRQFQSGQGDELIRLLLDAGSDPRIRTQEGKLPVDELDSKEKDTPEGRRVVEMLEAAAAARNDADSRSGTAGGETMPAGPA
jgi:ankyrin repeat protein